MIARQQVHAREARPLPVGREQAVALLGLEPASGELRGELDEPEIPQQASLGPAETLDADEPDQPGTDAALAPELARRPRSVGQVRSASRSSERQMRTSAAPRRAPSPSRASSAGEKRPSSAALGGACRPASALRSPCARRAALGRAGASAEVDQLAGERAQERVGDRRGA